LSPTQQQNIQLAQQRVDHGRAVRVVAVVLTEQAAENMSYGVDASSTQTSGMGTHVAGR
jgi:hypothetical protein